MNSSNANTINVQVGVHSIEDVKLSQLISKLSKGPQDWNTEFKNKKSIDTSKVSLNHSLEVFHHRVRSIDYRCDNRRFWLSAHNCKVPTPTSQNLELEQRIRIFGAD
jgi:hypothetical protein